jgi:hypothetical protein
MTELKLYSYIYMLTTLMYLPRHKESVFLSNARACKHIDIVRD